MISLKLFILSTLLMGSLTLTSTFSILLIILLSKNLSSIDTVTLLNTVQAKLNYLFIDAWLIVWILAHAAIYELFLYYYSWKTTLSMFEIYLFGYVESSFSTFQPWFFTFQLSFSIFQLLFSMSCGISKSNFMVHQLLKHQGANYKWYLKTHVVNYSFLRHSSTVLSNY